jgi:glycosyltransferase involved in cell wall biosynthesis
LILKLSRLFCYLRKKQIIENDMTELSLSILMANYNNSSYLPRAVDSVWAQTCPDWELCLLDDASTDRSWEIMQAFPPDPRLITERNPYNIGYIRSLKKLVGMSRYPILAILDSDDFLYPDAVSLILDTYRRNPDCRFVYTQFCYVDARDRPLRAGYCQAIPEGSSHLRCQAVSHWKTFHRNLYDAVGGYDESMTYCEDYDLIYRMEEVTTPLFIDRVAYAYRVLPDTQSRLPSKKALGLLHRSRSMVKAYRRRKTHALSANIPLALLVKKVFLTSAYGLLHGQFRGVVELVKECCWCV